MAMTVASSAWIALLEPIIIIIIIIIIMDKNGMNDISIDCETLSTRPNAAVISIGAVAFNRKTTYIKPVTMENDDGDKL